MDWRELIFRGVESDVLDYKAPMDWNLMSRAQKAKFVRHALAFANTKGGAIVVGVGEDASGHPSLFTGLDERECHSFDPSAVGSFINRYADPAIDLTVERPEVDGKRYAVLVIKPFRDLPHVCSTGLEEELQQGVFYIRTPSASSRPAARAGELHDLIRRALRNQRELLGRMIRGILYENQNLANAAPAGRNETEDWPPEYGESCQFFSRRLGKNIPPNTPQADFAAVPAAWSSNLWPLAELQRAAGAALTGAAELPKRFFSQSEIAAGYATNVSLRGMNREAGRFWQLYRNGLVHFRIALTGGVEEEFMRELLREAVNFTAFFYNELGLAVEEIRMELAIDHTENLEMRSLHSGGGRRFCCRIPAVRIGEKASAAMLLSGRSDYAARLFRELAVRFNVPLYGAEEPLQDGTAQTPGVSLGS